jgi:hypothetical protein
MISSISSINYKPKHSMIDEDVNYTDLVIGFYDGEIEIYSLEFNCTLGRFNISSEMVLIS